MAKAKKLLRFVRNAALDVIPDLLLPGAAGLVLKGCQHFYCCFLATDPGDKLDLLTEARALTPDETESLVDALAAGWCDRLPGGKLDDRQRARLRDLVRSLASASQVPEPQQAEELRTSLNRSMGGAGQITPNPLPPGQLALGRSVMALALGGTPRGRHALPGNTPVVPGHRMLAVLGTGGFGTVFLALHESDGQMRAVKVGRTEDRRRFEAEVGTLRQFATAPQTRLVRYHDHGVLSDGRFWIAMEYLGETTLADLLSHPPARPDAEQALHIAEEMLHGLTELHAWQAIHRDLKPENVMAAPGFRIRLIDFGLVKPTASLLHTTQETKGFVGTPLYASPEQVDEETLGPPSDIWSFGCILYQMLTGSPPYQPKNPLQVSKTFSTTKVIFDRPEIPVEVRGFLARCLTLTPGERWPDAIQTLAAFQPLRQECSKRMRHERYRASWVPVLERQMLERFAAQHQGRQPADAVANFAAFARTDGGVAALDEIRLGEVLPPVFAARARVEAAKQEVTQAKAELARNAARLNAAELVQMGQRIGTLEQAVATREQEVTQTAQKLLEAEVRTWQEEKTRAENAKREADRQAELARAEKARKDQQERDRKAAEAERLRQEDEAARKRRAQNRWAAIKAGLVLVLILGVVGLGWWAVSSVQQWWTERGERQARLEREKEKQEREAKEKAEQLRLAHEKEEREAKEKAEQLRLAQEKEAKAKELADLGGKIDLPAITDATKHIEIDLGKGAKLKMVRIPAKGKTFTMGSPASENGRSSDETQHDVTFTKDFFLGVYEVTQAQYEAVMGTNPSHFKGNTDFPVECVSWDDAKSFCDRLNQRISDSRFSFRLPREAEWEYSCRGGSSSPYHFGDTLTTTQANIRGAHGKTCQVGSYPANAFGLHDMHGNVWEWCQDWDDENSHKNGARTDPTGPTTGNHRVRRGGSWFVDPVDCRAAYRFRSGPGNRYFSSGFRVALSSP